MADEYTPLPEGMRHPVTGERLLSDHLGLKTWHSYDELNDRTQLRYSQECDPILETNRIIQNEWNGVEKNKAMHHVASIPFIVIELWKQEGIDINNKDDWPAVRRKLNDPDFRGLRTGLGNL